MPSLDGTLIAMLAAALVAVQAVCWLLARGLGLRLPRRVMLLGVLAPFVLLFPWLSPERLLAPTDVLFQAIPDAPWVQGGDEHSLLNDTLYQILPWELEVRHALSGRRLPFWSDLHEGGSAIWANPQAGALSPLAMAARVFPLQHHLLATLALKILVAFSGTWLLARRVGRTRASSLLAAAGFALGGGILSWALFPVTATVAWVPWLTLGTVRLFRKPSGKAVATTAVITAAVLLSGHPESAAIGGLFAAVCGLGLRRRAAGFGRGLGAAALAAVLGFGLAAPHILPFLHLVPESQRAHETLAEGMPAYSVHLFAPLTWFAPGYGGLAIGPANPHAFGRPYRDPYRGPINWADSEAGYTGLVAFAGAVVALFAVRDRRARPFLLFGVLALLLAAKILPLAHLIHAVPLLRVPAYSRFLTVGSLALCVAGAFGLDRLLFRRQPGREPSAWVALALAGAASLAVTADGWTLGLWAALLAAALIGRWQPRWAVLALGAVLVADLVPWGRSHLPVGPPGLFYPRTEFLSILEREAGDGRIWRAVGGDYMVYPSLLPVYGMAEVRPHNPLAPMRSLRVLRAAFGFNPSMGEYFSPFRNLDHPFLDFLGVRAVATSVGAPAGTLVPLDGGRYKPYFLFGNPDALPRWFLPSGVEIIEPAAIEPWIAGLRDPGRVAVLRGEAGSWRPVPRTGGPHPVRLLSGSPGRVDLEIPLGGETLLATSIPWSEGWRARSGGDDLQALTVNGAFLGVRLPAGVSRVELRFLPPGLLAGTVACGISLLGVIGLLAPISRAALPGFRRRARPRRAAKR
ncbi:MAG TPA: YfhO family protein [Thermoanaerobaculia bacterium]|nr:YfhO family protein [Thermoanaerobaculia bacterium]